MGRSSFVVASLILLVGGACSGGSSGAGTGGAPGSGGASTGTGGAATGGAPGSGGAGGTATTVKFSFFVASMDGMVRLAGTANGFGGDLRYGQADGLAGADKICTELAEASLAGAGQKRWRAFLSVGADAPSGAVSAISRVGGGPWYDRMGRLVATNVAGLANARPQGADTVIANDLPNEFGIPNHQPDPSRPAVDNHHVLTGSGTTGALYGATANCSNWTSTAGTAGRPRIGFSWIAGNRTHWISGQDEGGCGAGINLTDTGGSDPNNPIVGSGGGYGAIYCFALTP